LLVKRETRGYCVPKLSGTQVAELLEVRLVLETGCAGLAVQRATAKDLAELEDICADMDRMARGGYAMGLGEADLRFHAVLVRAAGNPRLTQLYQSANLPMTFVNPVHEKRGTSVLVEDARQDARGA
jgi:DNA-binding GntR family transcriptional regulator